MHPIVTWSKYEQLHNNLYILWLSNLEDINTFQMFGHAFKTKKIGACSAYLNCTDKRSQNNESAF